MPHLNDVRLMLRSCSPASTKVAHLVQPELRLDEVRMIAVVVEQRLLILRQAEVVALLLQALDLVAARRTLAVNELRLGDEDLVDGAVPALVVALVDIAGSLHAAPDLLRRRGNGAARWCG